MSEYSIKNIKKYIRYYKQKIAGGNLKQIGKIEKLIDLGFALDAQYDRGEYSTAKLRDLQASFLAILDEDDLQVRREVYKLLMFHKLEFVTDFSGLDLNDYLFVMGNNVGTHILTHFIATTNKIPLVHQQKSYLNLYKFEIDRLLRLANDNLDFQTDALRKTKESKQIKLEQYIRNKWQFKLIFYWYYSVHKVRYILLMIYFLLSSAIVASRRYDISMINICENVLALGFKVYVTDKKSVWNS